ncbi:MAG: branched-chain amino acid aminotransferase [Kiritimatiellae bacterium]|jgi:branched-chain amino acid aminotransferase|nr:branched-chain amino acid aminotransferase [Kiritimatiellia bacterium]
MNITIIKAKSLKEKPDPKALGFGKHFTDYMFEMDYFDGKGWINPTIKPYEPLELHPSSLILHYGQAVFEGLKAYKSQEGKTLLFRPEQNFERLNISSDRMCIPEINVNDAMDAMYKLLEIENDWIPTFEGTSLYIRPFIFANENALGVSTSAHFKFMIILTPVGAYYSEGFSPVKIYVEQKYVRAVPGGVGMAKTAGNYAASIKAQYEAKKKGYSQVLWLDGCEHKYVEEVGTMNVFFKVNGEVITPELNGSILSGITRNSVIQLLKSEGYKVTERRIELKEIFDAADKGELDEVFGTGTAAVISPVGELATDDKKITISDGKVGKLSQWLYNELTDIQNGIKPDKFGWVKTL